MRRFRPLLLATALFGAALPVLAVPDAAPDDLDHNRRLLDRWRAEPDHYARLLRDLQAFRALPPDRQERMRRLDHDLHEEDPASQARLWEVMERYVDWRAALPESDRWRIDEAPDRAARLQVVKELREREWVARLPKAERDDLDAMSPSMRAKRVADLRKIERQERKAWRDWADAQKTRPDAGPRPTRPARLSDLPEPAQTFVRDKLTPALKDADKARLRDAEGKWPDYPLTLYDLAHKYNQTPPGPRDVWAHARSAGLPSVPRHVLYTFLHELPPDERTKLQHDLAPLDEPEQSEMLREEYFRRNPQELPRWRRLERKTKEGRNEPRP